MKLPFALCLWYSFALFIATQAFVFHYEQSLKVVNPLRGFATYRWEGSNEPPFPTTLEYSYVAMKDLMPTSTTFDMSPINQFKQEANARGRQIIVRIYLDYPDCCPDGQYNTGVPAWLLTGQNSVTLTSYSEYGGGQSPDYTNTRLIAAIKSLIAELGRVFDGDNGIAYIKLGLLGFWGEWHTYPHNNFFPPLNIQNEVLTAYSNAFSITKLLVSADQLQYWEEKSETSITGSAIGWHDDNFCVATYDNKMVDWHFWPRVMARNMQDRWMNAPIGGEIQPAIQKKLFDSQKTCADCQNYEAAVKATHATWLLFNDIFDSSSGLPSKPNVVQAATVGSQLLGYQFYLKSLELMPCSQPSKTCFDLTVSIQNIGSAPFYYPLQLVGRINSNAKFTITDQLHTVMPNTTVTVFTVRDLQVPPNQADLEMQMLTISLVSDHVLPTQNITFANKESDSSGQIQATFSLPVPSNGTADVSSEPTTDDSTDTSQASSPTYPIYLSLLGLILLVTQLFF